MLEPDGIYRYTTIAGAVKTVKAYRLSDAPDPVEEYYQKKR